MSQNQPSEIRVSDTEREDALGKLGEHMAAGRLDIDEFGERSARVATAKTRGELLALFGDLPEPRPAFGQPVPPNAVAPREKTFAEKYMPVAAPVVAIVVIAGVMIALKVGFFVPFLFLFLFFNGRWGGGNDRRRAMHERHRRMYRGYTRRR